MIDPDDDGCDYEPIVHCPEGRFAVLATDSGQRLDVFLAAALEGATRSEAQRLIESSSDSPDSNMGVRVNGRREKSNYRLRTGDVIIAIRPEISPYTVKPEAIALQVAYEDSDILVIDKARGMVVHPAPGTETGTLVNAILAHARDLSGIGGELRPGIVHRLDKDTGGLLVVAKNDEAHRHLQRQIEARTAVRKYLALVWGVPTFRNAAVDAPIGRHPTDRKKMAVVTDPHRTARTARTGLTIVEQYQGTFALLEAKLDTGRTHQIRVHCAYIHHPVVGDPVYGGVRKVPAREFGTEAGLAVEQAIRKLNGQALHAYSLAFTHPRTGAELAFTSPLPECFQELVDLISVNHGRV